MKKVYIVGNKEKHRLEIKTDWLLGMMVLKLDGKTLMKKSFFLKMDLSFEIGDNERHLLSFKFNLFDYWQERMHVSLDGMEIPLEREIVEDDGRVDTPVDDAAAAFYFMSLMNVVFSVIGTLFVPDLDSLQVRLLLLVGAFIYLLFGLQTMRGHQKGFLTGCIFYALDSSVFLFYQFSWGGLCVRAVIAYYLFLGYVFSANTIAARKKAGLNSTLT